MSTGVFTITKWCTFEASHKLEGLPPGHKCGRVHGHSYKVEITFAARNLDEAGFVLDFGALSGLFKALEETFDHRHLNEVVPFNPTAENLARHIFELTSQYLFNAEIKPDEVWPYKVTVHETRKCSASYEVPFFISLDGGAHG